MTTPIPPPSPPARPGRGVAGLYVIGVTIAVLLLVLIVAVLDADDETVDSAATATTPGSAASTVPVSSDPTAPPSTAPATTTVFDLDGGDILISGGEGVRQVRDGVVIDRPIREPAEFALGLAAGPIVYITPASDAYPDFWPGPEPVGDPAIHLADPGGSATVLYSGGASLRMFEIAVVPAVGPSPAAIIMRNDLSAQGALTYSLVVVPLDGSEPAVVSEGLPRLSGAAWFDDRFIVAVDDEGAGSFLTAIDVNGVPLPWPDNPVSIDRPDPTTWVEAITRIPGTSHLAYAIASGGVWEGSADLVVVDLTTAAEVWQKDAGIPQAVIKELHAGAGVIATSKLYDLRDGQGWSFDHVPLAVYDATSGTVIPTSIPGGGTYSVVPAA